MKVDQLNLTAIALLEEFGNKTPTQKQINQMELLLSSTFMHKKAVFDDRLSAIEIACLYWVARGKSSKETAPFLKLTQTQVEFYRREIRRKLSCLNMAQAVFEGIRYGYLEHSW